MAQQMILQLNAAGMTALHKAGLAGLYMTLNAFERKNTRIEGLTWELNATQINLNWTDDKPKAAFKALIEKSFRVEKGFIRLAGLEPDTKMSQAHQHHLYQALLNSFLQFGPHRPTESKRDFSYKIDESSDKVFWIKDFAPIKKIRQHDAVADFTDSNGNFKNKIEASGWLYPGGGQRHVAHNDTKLYESLYLAFALLFAPVGVIYYLIRSTSKGRKSRLAMLMPDISDLKQYARLRTRIAKFGVTEMTAGSSSDAVLRMLLSTETERVSDRLSRSMHENFICRVVTFGIVGWNEKQKTRTDTRNVIAGKLPGLENYRIADGIFKNRIQSYNTKIKDDSGKNVETESHFVTTYSAREMIANNIARGKNWYDDISTFTSQKETLERIKYEAKELYKMIQQAKFDDETKRLFIEICHDSWRVRLAKLGERAKKDKTDFNALVRKDAEKQRTALMRSKNAESVRETVVDLWARGGRNQKLEGNGVINLLQLFDDKNWREARDLALLALISYQPRNQDESKALEESTQDNVEINNQENHTGDEE